MKKLLIGFNCALALGVCALIYGNLSAATAPKKSATTQPRKNARQKSDKTGKNKNENISLYHHPLFPLKLLLCL